MAAGAAFDFVGGESTFAALVMKGRNAQIVNFAKFDPFPDSGPSCSVQRKPGESPTRP